MNIFFIGLGIHPSSGGIERFCHTNLQFLSTTGHRLYTYVFDQKKPFFQGEGERKPIVVNTHVPRWPIADKFLRPYRLAHYLKDKNIDLIFCGHLHLAPIADKLAQLLGKQYDLFVYGIDCWGGRFQAYQNAFTRLRYVASISSFTTQQILLQNCPKNKVLYIPPVVPFVENHASHINQSNQDNQKNSTSSFTLLTVGRLSSEEQYKGHDMVIESLVKIREKIPGIKYWIVGRGQDQQRLEKLVEEKNLSSIVKFWGFVSDEDLPALYAQSDAFVLLSKVSLDPNALAGEGFGIVFLEAALHQKPLIGPNIGGPTDIIKDGYNGYQVDPHSSQEFIQKVIELAGNRDLCLRMGKNALETVREKFSLQQLPHYLSPLLT